MISTDQWAMYEEAMRLRAKHGKPRQTITEENCNIAQAHCELMAKTRQFKHSRLEEIIAHGQGRSYNALSCFPMWMNSPGHRAWLLSNRLHCGFGVIQIGDEWLYAGDYCSGDESTHGEGNVVTPPPIIVPPREINWLDILINILRRRW